MKKLARIFCRNFALTLGAAAIIFSSCEKNDIDDINKKIDEIKSSLTALETSVGNTVADVTYNSETGELTVTGTDGSTSTVTINDGGDVPEYTLSIDGNQLKLYKDSEVVSTVALPTTAGGAAFDPTKLVLEDGVVKYDGTATGVTIPGNSITQIMDADQEPVGYLITIGDESVKFYYQVPVKSIVFDRETYLGGVESIRPYAVTFTPWSQTVSDEPATATGEVWDIASTALPVWINPVDTAYFNLNPSNVTKDQISAVAMLAEDTEYVTRATTPSWNPVVKGFDVEDGQLLVFYTVTGQELQKTDADSISNFAVKVTTVPVGNEPAREVVSDFAGIYKETLKNMTLVHATNLAKDADHNTTAGLENVALDGADELDPADNGVANTEITHTYTVPYTLSIASGIDVSDYIKVRYDLFKDDAADTQINTEDLYLTPEELAKYGLTINYSLSNYFVESNQTQQNDFAVLNTTTNILTAKLYNESGDPYAAVGRMPMIRYEVVDMNNPNNVANVGWIKFTITRDLQTVEASYNFGDVYLSCMWKDNVPTEWMNTQVYNKLQMSKAEFEESYNIVMDGPAVDVEGDGTVTEIENIAPPVTSATTVPEWTLNYAAQVTPANVNAKQAVIYYKPVAAYADSRPMVKITLTANVVHPLAAINNKISNYWFANDFTSAGTDAIKVNAQVPGEANSPTDGSAPAIKTSIDATFVGNTPKWTLDITKFTEFEQTTSWYEFSTANARTVVGLSGASYTLTVATDAQVSAKPNNVLKVGTTVIAELPYQESLYPGRPVANLVNYLNNATSQDILNASTNDSESFYAFVQVVAESAHDTANPVVIPTSTCENINLPFSNGEFKTAFIRPLDVLNETDEEFTDGQDNGSEIDVLKLVGLVDWRDRSFADNLGYYFYYGVNAMTVDIANITTTMNNGTLGTTKLSDITNEIVMTQTAGASGPIPNPMNMTTNSDYYGTLVYDNTGANVQTFVIRVPINVSYSWGTVTSYVDVTVNGTI